jgi:hypothetical protein
MERGNRFLGGDGWYAVDVSGKEFTGVRRGPTFSLLLVAGALGLAGCGEGGAPGKPELPESVSPGWVRKSFEASVPPAGLPGGTKAECWKAVYAGSGLGAESAGSGGGLAGSGRVSGGGPKGAEAEVWACGYVGTGGAFDAAQRTRAAADSVKFQEGKYLILIHWSGGSKDEVTALVRALQKKLAVK